MVVLVAIGAAIVCLNEVFQFESVRVATDASYAAAFGAAGSNAIVLLLLDIHHYGFLAAQIFFGLWLVPSAISPTGRRCSPRRWVSR